MESLLEIIYATACGRCWLPRSSIPACHIPRSLAGGISRIGPRPPTLADGRLNFICDCVSVCVDGDRAIDNVRGTIRGRTGLLSTRTLL